VYLLVYGASYKLQEMESLSGARWRQYGRIAWRQWQHSGPSWPTGASKMAYTRQQVCCLHQHVLNFFLAACPQLFLRIPCLACSWCRTLGYLHLPPLSGLTQVRPDDPEVEEFKRQTGYNYVHKQFKTSKDCTSVGNKGAMRLNPHQGKNFKKQKQKLKDRATFGSFPSVSLHY
jgi:hypothetical protein